MGNTISLDDYWNDASENELRIFGPNMGFKLNNGTKT